VSRTYFIAANDSDAGKSYLTALLWRGLQRRGVDAVALKPVACGVESNGINSDVALLQRLQPGQEINLHINPHPLAPWCDQPVSPDALLAWCDRRIASQRTTLIEGVGGLMVPLAVGFTQMDWIQALPEMEILLVVRARLGCLSQMLTHLELLDHHQHTKGWLIINIISLADLPYAEQCRDAADQWHPWVKVIFMMPEADDLPALMDWICR